MPMDRKRYPANWDEIARAVKAEADWKCECCGKQCRRPGEPFDTHRSTLTVAHLSHTPEGSMGSCLHRGACERAMRRFVGASDHVTPDPPRWLGCGDCDEFEEEGDGDGDR